MRLGASKVSGQGDNMGVIERWVKCSSTTGYYYLAG
jgi:hypothetical protein